MTTSSFTDSDLPAEELRSPTTFRNVRIVNSTDGPLELCESRLMTTPVLPTV